MLHRQACKHVGPPVRASSFLWEWEFACLRMRVGTVSFFECVNCVGSITNVYFCVYVSVQEYFCDYVYTCFLYRQNCTICYVYAASPEIGHLRKG